MRLIDADVLEKVMTEDWFLEILATQDSKSAIKKDIVNCIDSVPLAYDVEKVVAELEECKIKRSDDSIYGIGVLNGYAEAIDIVKRGGIE